MRCSDRLHDLQGILWKLFVYPDKLNELAPPSQQKRCLMTVEAHLHVHAPHFPPALYIYVKNPLNCLFLLL